MEVTSPIQPDAVVDTEDEQANWEMEKAEMKRIEFNQNRELDDMRERVADLASSNGKMLNELSQHAVEINEHIHRQRVLEAARNELTDKNLELEAEVARLKIIKEERDAAVVSATKLAQTAQVETFALKDEIRKLINDHAVFKHTKEALEKEVQTIQFERQKYATERSLYNESKSWLMQEVAERDNKVSSLRLELSNKDMQGANERLQYIQQVNLLNAQVSSLNEKNDMLNFTNADLVKRLQNTELLKASEIANLEEEIRCQTELQKVMKISMEESKCAADCFKDQLNAQEQVLIEVKRMLQEHQDEMERGNIEHAEAIKKRDEELAETCAELAKVSEMMKSMSDVKLNVSEEELSELAPAAAETVRYLKGGQSLSGLVLEYARVRGRLAEIEDENVNLRTTLEELLETIEQKKPHLISQRIRADEIYDKNMKVEKQLDLAETERRELLSQRDSAMRDLAYVRAELEKYQRDFEFVTKRNAELMYAVERQSRMQDPSWSEKADEQLFQNIVQLQRRNVELESDIENAKTKARQAAMNAQSEEMAQLRADLAVTKKSEAELKTKVEQTKAAFDNLKERTEHFKELVRDSVTAAEARTARLRAEEAIAAKLVADATIERLRKQLEECKADHVRRDQELEQRIQNTEANISSVTETNIKLNAMLDVQKTNTAAMEHEYKSSLKEKEAILEELRKVTAEDAEKERRLVDLGRQALEATSQAGSLRVRVRALEDELQSAKTEVNSLQLTANGQRAVLEKEEQVRMSVVEMANFLSRVEAEKLTHANTQLDVLRLERDSLKASTTRLSDQLNHNKNDSKIIQQRLEKELEVTRLRLAEKEGRITRDEMELVDLRSKLSAVHNQYTGSDTTGMTPDRLKREHIQLKTRNQYLESELDDAKRKLLEFETTQKRMNAEHAISTSHNNVLEENLKQSEQMGTMEKERLIASAKCFEERAQQLTESLTQNQKELDEIRKKYDEQSYSFEKDTSELRRQLQVASLNLENSKRELEVANNSIINMQNDATRNASALEQHTSIVRQFEDRIAEIETDRLRLQAELSNSRVALVAETTAKKEADQLREHVERQLQKKAEELNALEELGRQKQIEYDTKLADLSLQYESLSSNLTSHKSSIELTDDREAQSSMVINLQSVLQFVRESKDEALTRAMNAEVEMRRLRAETAEHELGRNKLLQKIRDLETEKVATAASLVDRANLIEKVHSLTAVHNINSQLTEEKTKMQAQLVQIQKEKTELEKQKVFLVAKNEEQKLKIASSDQEAIQRKREIEQLKQRNQANARGAAIQATVDQLKSQLATTRQELTSAIEKASASEEKNRELQNKFIQTRQLAIRYRDEVAELKKTTDSIPNESDSWSARLNAQCESHLNEITELKTKIEEQKKEMENLEMKSLRLSVLEKSLKKTNEQVTDLKQQNEKLMEANRRLSQPQTVSATDVESKAANPPVVSKPSPFVRNTPTKLSNPAPAQLKLPNEPDQAGGHKTLQQPPFSGKRASFGKQTQSSSNIVPPAPAPTVTTPLQKQSPVKRPIPPSIPNEPVDVIPPVPSDNIPDPTPPTNAFGSILPVPHTFQTSVRVPTQSLFSSSSTTTVQPQPEKKNLLPSIDSVPSTPGSNVITSMATTTSLLNPVQQPFGSTGGAPVTLVSSVSTDNLALPDESVVEGAAGQSSLVSGSIDQQKVQDVGIVANDSESRDGTSVGGVSSSDVRRKRTANDFELTEAKRQRESPNETVTSSETRQQSNLADIPELDDDEGILEMGQDVSDEDPNDNTLQERRPEVIDLENDEEVIEDEMDEEEDDDSFGNDEEYEEEEGAPEGDDDDDVVVLSDGDDGPENDNDAESLNDVDDDGDVEEIEMVEESNNDDIEEILGGEDSQPSLDDQDREAASAVEEAEDEGRDPLGAIDEPSAPADPTGASGIGNAGRIIPDAQRVRLPTGLREAEREDQCSSSNETNEERPAALRNPARLQRPTRGAKPTRGVYTPGRGNRGGRGGSAS